MRSLIVLDRDGVINYESSAYIKAVNEWQPIPGSLEAIALLTQHGFTISIATNQSGIGRGLFSEATLQEIHRHLLEQVHVRHGKVDSIYFCPHLPEQNCLCRKPKPGLLYSIANDYACSTQELLFIGDSKRDYEAAKACGAQFILVLTGYGQSTFNDIASVEERPRVFQNLYQFAKEWCKGACTSQA